MKETILIAFHPASQTLKHIDNIPLAEKGLRVSCICLQCKKPLKATIDVQKQIKHFKHHKQTDCTGAQETALHELGKQIIVQNKQINIPKRGCIVYSNPVAEQGLENWRPDVSVMYYEKPLFFEIFVTHAVDKQKAAYFINGKHRCIEIDLSHLLDSSFDEIQDAVLNKTENKKEIFWDDKLIANQFKEETKNSDLLKIIVGGIILFGIREIFTNQKRRKRY